MPVTKKRPKPRPLKINPSDDIGPPWRWVGVLIIVAIVGLFIHEQVTDHPIDREFVYMAIVGVAAGMGLIRPSFLDNLVKGIADKLPGFSFTKKETAAEEEERERA